MSEQQKQPSLGPAIFISVIILAALIIWAVVKRQPGEQAYHEHFPAPSESPDESAGNLNRPKISLNDVISSARTWRPSYTSWYGKTAPDFTLTDLEGKEHKLSDYRGKDVMLVFWGTWCPPCEMEIPHLIELRKTVSEDKLAILAISNEKPQVVKKFAAHKKMNYTLLLEQGNMPNPFGVMRIYRTVGVPSSFFIDPEGKIKFATVGLLSLDPIKAILQAE